jgi:putative component of membrane protein insertase Oxa1/YidC/SpoIIIJ protein YidD
MNIFTLAAINSITWYQHTLSRKKGFDCAYRIYHNGQSCSNVVKQAFAKHGFVAGIQSVFTQATNCRMAAISLMEQVSQISDDDQREENTQNCNKQVLKDASDVALCCVPCYWS